MNRKHGWSKQSLKERLSLARRLRFESLEERRLLAGHATGTWPGVPGNTDGLFVVEDAPAQFAALKHHGEALAWRNPESLGAPDPSIFDHYQGLARYPGSGTPVFYVSQLDDDDGGIAGGYVHVVQFGTRPTTGERLRSNLQRLGADTEEVTPAVSDTWIRSIRFDGTPMVDGTVLPTYKHPGAMAVVDDILFVPVDQPTSSSAPTGQVLLFDVGDDRLNPELIQAIPLDHGIDNLAVTERPDGTYLIWTNGGGGSDINVYRTTGADLRDPGLGFVLLQNWSPSGGLVGGSWPTGAGAHQSSTFVREPDGSLYLMGMRHPGGLPFAGSDFADLYEVDEPTSGQFVLTLKQTRKLFCVYDGGGGPVDMRICNFTAAGGGYVSPTGELILYSMPHDDEDGFSPDIARMGEFRHRDVNRATSPLRLPQADANGPYEVDEGGTVLLSGDGVSPLDRPWIELYDDDGFNDRSIVVDYDDRHSLELSNFNNLDNFNDKTTSVRWRTPVGLDIELYDDDGFRDRYIVLRGTGQTESISNLKTQGDVPGLVEQFNPSKETGEALDFNDKTSSLRFVGAPPAFGAPVLTWDLDGDGFFGETGAPAARGDEVGSAPTFDASNLDGPAQGAARLRVTVPGSTPSAIDTSVIEVRNVAPRVELTPDRSSISEGEEVNLQIDVVDPGKSDEVTLELDWGDGTTEILPLGLNRTVTVSHQYIDDDPTVTPEDTYMIAVSAEDDDGGTGSAMTPITVANVPPVPTIVSVADGRPYALSNVPISLVGDFVDVGTADTHSDPIIDWGDGTSDTVPVDAISAEHVYTMPGTYTIGLTVRDDDSGVGTVSEPFEVLSPAASVDRISGLLDELRRSSDSEALDEAQKKLLGARPKSRSGALDKIELGNLAVAVLRLGQATEPLQRASDEDGIDTLPLQELIAWTAFSIANTLFGDIVEAYTSPNRGEAKQIARISANIDLARDLMSTEDYIDAIDAFHDATKQAG